jgi:hypothetical protein
MAGTVYYRFLIRAYTADEWTASNGILLERELGIETDTLRGKFGDGSTPWNDLEYSVLGLGQIDQSTLADGNTLQWDAITSTWRCVVPASFVPTLVPDATTFLIPENKQALFALPIELAGSSSIEFDGDLIEVA